jgi:dipeptidase D
MTGAENLKPGLLDGDILINMDSEDEGELYIGCAGGVDTSVVYQFNEEPVPTGMVAYKVGVSGLKGGHSGLDIHLGKGNACLILNQTLLNGCERYGIRIANIDAGSLRNAIPREGYANVVVTVKEEDDFIEFIKEEDKKIKDTLKEIDPDVKITAEKVNLPGLVMDIVNQHKLLNGVAECPNGVLVWDKNMPDVVQTSSNLAIMKSENGRVEIAILTRSAVDNERDEYAGNYGAEASHHGAYPGWKPNVDSIILETMKSVYNNKFGKVPEVKVIHAGLECGILGAIYPNWDMISFGPTIRFPHSPDEKVNIATVEKFWDFLVETLKNAPQK